MRERLEETLELAAVALARIVQVEDLADLGERKPEPLAAQDQLDAGALALAGLALFLRSKRELV